MIIDETIKRVIVGNTDIQRIMHGGVFCGSTINTDGKNTVSHMRIDKEI